MHVPPPPARALRRLAGAALLLAAPAAAQQPAPAPTQPAESLPRDTAGAPRKVDRAGLPSWLSVNGYLTQAFGASRGGLLSGFPDAGTADHRRAAVLARVQPTLADRFVVQIAHRRVGQSPAAQFQPDLRLDWLFYERSFGDATRVRLGRIPLPAGIYNETRYVGTLLPFYQAPTSTYREKEFSNEALDGALAAHEVRLGGGFSLEAAAFGGGFRYVEASQFPVPPGPDGSPAGWTYATARARASNVVGTNLWLNTPVPGLRVGGGAVRARVSGGLRPGGAAAPLRLAYAAVDGTFDRYFVRAETLFGDVGDVHTRGGYVQVGGRVVGRLSLNAQADYSHLRFDALPLPPTFAARPLGFLQHRAHGVSAIWAFRPTLQARLEGHLVRGYNVEEALDLAGPPRSGRFVVLSLSAAF